jgi:hypothetical protein
MDASHRVIDAIAEQLAAGEYPEDVAKELDVPLEGVHAVLAATIKLTLPPVPGLGVRRILAWGKQVGVAVQVWAEHRQRDGVWAAELWPVADGDAPCQEEITRDRLKDLRAALLERLEQKGMWWTWD